MPRNDNISKVNQSPRGLQSLLGNVNQGVNPHELNHVVGPGVNLLPFWGVDKTVSTLGSASVAGVVGQGTAVTVPEGELWILRFASVQWFVPANATRAVSLRIQDASAGKQAIIAYEKSVNSAVAGAMAAQERFTDFILPTGWGIRGQCEESDDIANSTMTISVVYYKLAA